MSRIRFAGVTAASVPVPSAGKASLFYDSSDNVMKIKLDNGSVVTLNVSDEYIQDIIGNMIQDSSTVDVTYNDVGNTISISVIQSALDHGSIGGLGDDDHTQYHNDTRGDIRYYTKSQVDTLLDAQDAASEISVVPTGNLSSSNVQAALGELQTDVDNINDILFEPNVIVVKPSSPGPGQFTSIAAAAASIVGSSPTNPYVIRVSAGVYTEPVINLPQYTSVEGESIQSVQVNVSANNHHLFELSVGCELSFMSLYGLLGSGYSAIHAVDCGDFVQTHKLSIYDFDIGILHEANTTSSTIYVEYTDINGDFTNAVKAISLLGNTNRTQLENFYTYESTTVGAKSIYATGSGVELQLFSVKMFNDVGQNGIVINNGVVLRANGLDIQNGATAIHLENTGTSSSIYTVASTFKNNTLDYDIDHPAATGSILSGSDKNKVQINATAQISVLILDTQNPGIILNGPLYYSEDSYSDITDISKLLIHTPTMGVTEGGILSVSSGLTLAVTAGYGYSISSDILVKRTWTSSTLVLSANTSVYIYINTSGILTSNVGYPDTENNILLGRVVTSASNIEYIENTSLNARHWSNLVTKNLRESIGSVYYQGSIVTESGTRNLDITAGEYYFAEHEFLPAGGIAVTFDAYYRSATPGIYTKVAGQTVVDNAFYDNGSGTLAAIPNPKHAKHLILNVGGPSEKYLMIYATAYYDTAAEAEAADLPTLPNWIKDSFVKIASIVVGPHLTNFHSIQDIRPRIGFSQSAGGGGGATDHGALTGLGDDDHTQYLLVSGTRAMSGSLDMGANAITNVGLVDGVDVSAHASRHLPNGTDPLTTGVVSSVGSANSEGIANALARQDHVHNHGSQTTPTHHAVATTTDNGFMSSTDKTKLDNIGGTRAIKSGVITAGSFTGNPKKATLTFGTAFGSANYSISIVGGDGRVWSTESQVAASIVINANSNTALTQSVLWIAIDHGESVE